MFDVCLEMHLRTQMDEMQLKNTVKKKVKKKKAKMQNAQQFRDSQRDSQRMAEEAYVAQLELVLKQHNIAQPTPPGSKKEL